MANVVQPAVRLRAMTDLEFAGWRETSIEHHAAQVSRATGKDLTDATVESRVLLGKILAAGLATEHMQFFVLVDDAEVEVGWLWLGPAPEDPAAGFVFDVIIDADHRGRGLGRAAMLAAERYFRDNGKSRVVLTVAGGNDVARRLYESLGYRPISTAMSKHLDG